MWIEIFKAGTHTDSGGKRETYSPESLDSIVARYNDRVSESTAFEAPVVKGHPANNEPAMGWVERLARRGDRLLAKLRGLMPEFIEEISQGRFKKISVALYPDMMLRHVGFLGATVPAVKGLRNVAFSDNNEFREFASGIATEGQQDSENLPEPIESAETNLNEKKDLQNLLDEALTKITTLEQENRLLKEKLALAEKEQRVKEFRDYVNRLIESEEGSPILPSQAGDLVDLLELAKQADDGMEKSIGGAGTYSEDSGMVSKVKRFVSVLKPVFSSQDFVRQADHGTVPIAKTFSEANVSEQRLKVHEKALEIQSQVAGLSYEEAVLLAQKGLY